MGPQPDDRRPVSTHDRIRHPQGTFVSVGFTLGIVVGAGAAVAAAVVTGVWSRLLSFARSTRSVIELDPEPELLVLVERFALLYVRDGKDVVAEAGPIRNRIAEFFPSDESQATIVARFRHSRRLGAQFKCFVDFEGEPADLVGSKLRRSGFDEPRLDEHRDDRVWFLLHEYPRVETVDGHTNNFVTFHGD